MNSIKTIGGFMFLAMWILVASGLTSLQAYAVGSQADSERPDHYHITAAVPEIVRDDIVDRLVALAAVAYEGVDADALRKDFEEYLSRGECEGEIAKAPPPYLCVDQGSQKIGAVFTTSWTLWMVTAKEPPVGVHLAEREGAVSLKEGETVAEMVLARVVPDEMERKHLILTHAYEFESDTSMPYSFYWKEPTGRPYQGGERTIMVDVRKSDGLVTSVSITDRLEEPKISFDEIVKRAKAAGLRAGGGFWEKYLSLAEVYHFGDRRLIWKYEERGEGYIQEAWWDANTGEVLLSQYSEVVKGSSMDKPYYNPDFWSYPSEAEVKARIEALLKQRAEELKAAKNTE